MLGTAWPIANQLSPATPHFVLSLSIQLKHILPWSGFTSHPRSCNYPFLLPESLQNSIHNLFRNIPIGKQQQQKNPTCSFFLIKETKWEGQIALRTFYRPGSTGNISSLKNLWQVTGTIYWGFLRDRPRIVKGNFSKRLHGLSRFSWEQLGLIRHNLQLALVTFEYLLTSSLYAKQRLISTWFTTRVLFPCSVPIFLFKCKSFWFNVIN